MVDMPGFRLMEVQAGDGIPDELMVAVGGPIAVITLGAETTVPQLLVTDKRTV